MSLFTVIKSREEFNNAIESNLCVVDFFAEWCGPCKQLSKTLESRVNELSHATFVKVDVDEFSDLAELYNVSALPYLLFFVKGKLQENYVKGNDPDLVVSVVNKLSKT